MNHELTGKTRGQSDRLGDCSMYRELKGMTHFYDSSIGRVAFGDVRIVLNETDVPFAEMHVSNNDSGATKVFRYTDPTQIAVLVDLMSAIETTHTPVEIPVVIH